MTLFCIISILVLLTQIGASLPEKSEEKGQCQKMKFVWLNMKENEVIEHRKTFLALYFGNFLAILGLGQKMPLFTIGFQKLI